MSDPNLQEATAVVTHCLHVEAKLVLPPAEELAGLHVPSPYTVFLYGSFGPNLNAVDSTDATVKFGVAICLESGYNLPQGSVSLTPCVSEMS